MCSDEFFLKHALHLLKISPQKADGRHGTQCY